MDAKTKLGIIVLCIICAATMMGGCIDQSAISSAIEERDAEWQAMMDDKDSVYIQNLKTKDTECERVLSSTRVMYEDRLEQLKDKHKIAIDTRDQEWREVLDERDAEYESALILAIERRDAEWQSEMVSAIEYRDAQWEESIRQSSQDDDLNDILSLLTLFI